MLKKLNYILGNITVAFNNATLKLIVSFIFVFHKINCFYIEDGNIHIFCTHIFMHHLENTKYASVLVMQCNYLLPVALCILYQIVIVGRTSNRLYALTPSL